MEHAPCHQIACVQGGVTKYTIGGERPTLQRVCGL